MNEKAKVYFRKYASDPDYTTAERRRRNRRSAQKSLGESVPELQDQGGYRYRHRGSLFAVGKWFSFTFSYFRVVSYNMDALRSFSR